MTRLRRPKPDLRCQSGYSLIELMTVMAILGLVLAGLTTMFQAGVRAEVRSSREFQAQQNARLAMDRLRRELHCANAISAPNGTTVATVSVTLPDDCPGADTSVTYATQSVATGRWQLTRSAGAGTPVVIADYLTTSTPFTYYVPATGTLGRLGVDLPVNLNYPDTSTEWRLQDDIVLRNTIRL
ncbi:MAG: prepilin-type N-terminal cleavage/methylation domain-containing protein [Actinobacteria bacterium]|nr:prepilin-type N-terminal cleavage/methylation domain-containing protein [Actinomycetota bacterium]